MLSCRLGVEIEVSSYSLHVSLVLWGEPIVDSGDLNRVHHNLVL